MGNIVLTDNGKKILTFMRNNIPATGTYWVGKDIEEQSGIKGAYSTLNSLVNRGLVEKGEPITRDFTNNKGETKPHEYQTYILTELGRHFVLD